MAAPSHKLTTPVIAAIAGAVVLIIGGATAAFALSGGHHTTPLPPVPPTPPSSAPSSAPSAPPSSAPSAAPTQGGDAGPPPTTPPGQSGSAAGGALDLGNGVTVALPAGWQVEVQSQGSAKIRNAAGVNVFFGHGTAHQSTVGQALASDAASFLKQLTNPATGDPKTLKGSGPHFDQLALEPFKGTLSTQSGTAELIGLFAEDFNSSTRDSVFVASVAGSSADLKAAVPDLQSMVGSLG